MQVAMYHIGVFSKLQSQMAKYQSITVCLFAKERRVFSLFCIFAFRKWREIRKLKTVVFHIGVIHKKTNI